MAEGYLAEDYLALATEIEEVQRHPNARAALNSHIVLDLLESLEDCRRTRVRLQGELENLHRKLEVIRVLLEAVPAARRRPPRSPRPPRLAQGDPPAPGRLA